MKFHGIKEGIENTNYLIKTSKNKFILTIFEKRVQKKDVPYFVKLMNIMYAKGFKCPKPVKDINNRYIFKVKNKPAIIVTFLDGKSKKKLNTSECYNIGKQIGKFHNISSKLTIKRKNTLDYKMWNQIYHKTKNIYPKYCLKLKHYLKIYEKYKPKKLAKGVIHADLFPDNIFFKNRKFSGFIDFYFSCYENYLYELAVCINALCFDRKIINKVKTKKLINGYQSVKKIKKSDLKYLNILCLGAAIRFFVTRLYDFKNTPKNAKIKKKSPKEYLIKMNYFYKNLNTKLYD
jgi:homoserine kinase type II